MLAVSKIYHPFKALKFWVNKLPLKRTKYLQFYILASFFQEMSKRLLKQKKERGQLINSDPASRLCL